MALIIIGSSFLLLAPFVMVIVFETVVQEALTIVGSDFLLLVPFVVVIILNSGV